MGAWKTRKFLDKMTTQRIPVRVRDEISRKDAL